MKVIAGTRRGRTLKSVRGRSVRPTSGRVREAVFGILGDAVAGARVLDLYAGSGALALEAMSRGARNATCVEKSRSARVVLAQNARALEFTERVRVVGGDAIAFARRASAEQGTFDVVFCDPPYGDPVDPLFQVLTATSWWTTVAVVEHAATASWSEIGPPFDVDTRRYGDTAVTFLWRES